MKQIKTKSGDIGIIEVPKLSFYFDWSWQSSNKIDPKIQIYWETEDDRIGGIITDFKDPKDFEILDKLSELTDKDCEEFVENTVRCNNCDWEDCEDNLKTFVDMSEHVGKEIYYYKGCPNCETDDYLMDIAKESFISLLQSEGLDTSKEFLIIKIL